MPSHDLISSIKGYIVHCMCMPNQVKSLQMSVRFLALGSMLVFKKQNKTTLGKIIERVNRIQTVEPAMLLAVGDNIRSASSSFHWSEKHPHGSTEHHLKNNQQSNPIVKQKKVNLVNVKCPQN